MVVVKCANCRKNTKTSMSFSRFMMIKCSQCGARVRVDTKSCLAVYDSQLNVIKKGVDANGKNN